MGKTFEAREPADEVRNAFLSIVHTLSDYYAGWLEGERERSRARAQEPAILWDELIIGIVAIQGKDGWSRLSDGGKMPAILGYDALQIIEPDRRQPYLEAILGHAGIYQKAKKAAWIAENVAKMERRHGPVNALALFEEASGRDGKIAFLKRFAGVGNKLARHIPMRLYHPEFRDSIAIDARISAISRLLGLRLGNFAHEEHWYVAAAHDAGLDGWTLDRLLYHAHQKVQKRLAEALAPEG